mgnify:CR=1 FL=1|jgi:hypothetical protein
MSEAIADEGVAEEEVEEQTDETTDEVVADEENSEEESESEDSEDQEEESEEVVAEELEFDFGGNKMTVPKDKIPEDLAQKVQEFGKGLESAHTKRSQALADASKGLEAREQAVQKLHGLHGETLSEYSKGLHLREELEELKGVDMSALWRENPDQARKVSDVISQKTSEFNTTVQKVTQLEQESSRAGQQEIARRANEGIHAVEKRVPGFAKDKAKDVIEYVVGTYGVARQEADKWPLNPAGAEMAYKAMLYDKMQTKANPKTVKKRAVPVKPVKSTKGGKGGVSKSNVPSDKDSVGDWLAKRERQIANKEKRR